MTLAQAKRIVMTRDKYGWKGSAAELLQAERVLETARRSQGRRYSDDVDTSRRKARRSRRAKSQATALFDIVRIES